MQAASVYLRRDIVFVHADSRTSTGVWIASRPFLSAVVSIADDVLGDLVLIALTGSVPFMPPPPDCLRAFAPLLRRAGVDTWEAFADGAVACGVTRSGRGFQVRDGLTRERNAVRMLPASCSLAELGLAVRRCLECARRARGAREAAR